MQTTRTFRRPARGSVVLRVRLTKKLARFLNGIDLDKLSVGDSMDLPERDARMLVAEGWAELPNTADGAADAPRNFGMLPDAS
jgi:hypothetical protein